MYATTRKAKKPSMIEFTHKFANDEEACLKFFFSSNKGMSGIEMSSALDVNYKTALLLCRKCRALMASSDSGRILDSRFYEADTAYIGSASRTTGKTGNSTEKLPFMAILSSGEEKRYPYYIKLNPIPEDNSEMTDKFLSKPMVLSKDRVLNTDGKTAFNVLKDRINHRYAGKGLIAKIQKYIYQSSPVLKKAIIRSLDLVRGYFNPDFA
jgi:hypothetical protein